NPATFTPSQVTLSGPAGTISGVSVTAVAGSNDHQFLISFAPQTAGGTYSLKVDPSIQDWYGNSMDQNRNGVNGEASDAFVYVVQPAAATLVKRDTTSQGNWIGAYGSQGYNIIGSAASYPSYATVSVAGETPTTWAATTNDPRALQTPGGAGRVAACWYSGTSFTLNINLTDGQAHDVAVYALDWPDYGRSEQIQVSSASTGAVLDTETISNFNGGLYLQWQITGNVIIQFSGMGGTNALLSGLFFDPPTPPSDVLSISSPSTTDTAGTAQTFTVTALGPNGQTDTHYTGTIHFSSTDPSAVLPANYTFTVADAGVHTFSATLETAGIQSIIVTDTASASIAAAASATVVKSLSASAALVKRDSTTEGNWIGAYGSQGSNIIGNAATYPSYATVSVSGQTYTTWAGSTSDPRALQTPGGASRIAACWYSGTSFAVNVNLTDGQAHDVAVYALDWPDYGRSEQIQVSSASTGAVLDTETISNFNGGLYLQWQITGNVIIQFSGMGGTNAVLSGLFFDPPTPTSDVLNISSPSTTDTAGTAQTFTVTALGPNGQTDTHYTGTIHFTSTDPHALLPANYTFTAADAGVHTFSATLETAGTQSVTATDSTNPSTTGTEPNITVAAAAASSLILTGFPNTDNASTAANFTVTAYDPYGNVATGYTGTVHFTSTDPQASLPANYTFTAADAGKHNFSATLKTAGTESITTTDMASTSITGTTSATVISSPSASAALLKLDSTTEGNWIGAYGSQGYNIVGSGASYPSYATVSVSGQTYTTWAGSTSDPRALQTPGGASRIAACWYSGTSFTVNVNLTDGQAHDIAVYALDWPDYGRSEQIQVSNAATGAVLSTETISNFDAGLYLQWKITGNVIIQFSGMGGTNAVVSGLFFDPVVSSTQSIALASLPGSEIAAQGDLIGAYNTSMTSAIGTVNFSSGDSQALLPADSAFFAALAGVPRRRPR
ncbi:MAG: hypothetical protein ACLQVF_05025, partial [Isosphaeraceae bacterium]